MVRHSSLPWIAADGERTTPRASGASIDRKGSHTLVEYVCALSAGTNERTKEIIIRGKGEKSHEAFGGGSGGGGSRWWWRVAAAGWCADAATGATRPTRRAWAGARAMAMATLAGATGDMMDGRRTDGQLVRSDLIGRHEASHVHRPAVLRAAALLVALLRRGTRGCPSGPWSTARWVSVAAGGPTKSFGPSSTEVPSVDTVERNLRGKRLFRRRMNVERLRWI